MRKGITPIIAIIVLLLITVALAGATWNYLFWYFNQIIAKQIEITDSFCISGNNAVILVRNAGTQAFDPRLEISLINATSGVQITAVSWSYADGSNLTGNIEPGRIARLNFTCPAGTMCSTRVSTAAGKSVRVPVQC